MDYTLKEIEEPYYDTIWFDREPRIAQNLFVVPDGGCTEHGAKTIKDTNARVPGCLGYPLKARWSFIRLFFEDWCYGGDVRAITSSLSLELMVGGVPVKEAAVSSFLPVFPRGGEKVMKEWLEKKEIEFWPWLETKIDPVEIDSVETFCVNAKFMGAPHLKGGYVKAKVILGPTLYIPDRYKQIHPEDRDQFGFGGAEPKSEDLI
jgi:hypothetical protein